MITIAHAIICTTAVLGPPDLTVDPNASRWAARLPAPSQVHVVVVPEAELLARGNVAELVHTPTDPLTRWTIYTPDSDPDAGVLLEVSKFWTADERKRYSVVEARRAGVRGCV